ncbi:electron transport complex subunit RsxC [Crassaminicella thermophila]|uniref:Ion-translocating oxidoreductase complex subunit C n=1 Tax=Crassaminicella thermophila TaxID=2599308 RepID=A0A5C0SF00_CRATE|nr:electron transport complex subunit RsxC [Crassaminicella thermophila]QEK12317.1 electron transport complex subunit RsxC [Crassaminicella thermophila]
MNLLSFRGGVHPPHYKEATERFKVEKAKEPDRVAIPLQQHIGAPCEPLVKVGDKVKIGQKIGEAKAFVSTPVHSSVSGEVKQIARMLTPTGEVECIVIEADGLNEVHESVKPKGDIENLSGKQILDIIKEAGIVGMGGATFPTHVKLSPPPEKKIDTIILNGAECEPYLTADHRLMLEDPESIVYGLRAMMKVVNVSKAYIGIEDNKPDAIESMKNASKGYKEIKVVGLKTKYPQGAEKQLIYACTKREVPSGGLPMDAGVIVNNVATASAVAKAIKTGMPLIERICTITGKGIKEPKNLLIKVGTYIKEIVEQCGGYNGNPGKIILGGPMMGLSQHTDEIPSTKGTSGILVFTPEEARLPEPKACIRCGKCVDICPAFLQPLYISAYSLRNMYETAEKYHALDCIECGSCSFICPSKRPLLQSIRVAKREIIAKKRKTK